MRGDETVTGQRGMTVGKTSMGEHNRNRGRLRRLVGAIDHTARVIERVLLAVAGLAIVTMMVLVTVNALGRYVFSAPITGAEVWVGVFLAPLATYLALASALSHRAHVGVTILVQRLPRKARRGTQIIGAWIVCATFIALAYQGGVRAFGAYSAGQIDPETGTPLWLAYIGVPIGCAGIALRAALLATTWWLDKSWQISLAQQEHGGADADQTGSMDNDQHASSR